MSCQVCTPNVNELTSRHTEKMFDSCNGPKNRVGRSVKKDCVLFGQKCVFYACFTLIGSWEG